MKKLYLLFIPLLFVLALSFRKDSDLGYYKLQYYDSVGVMPHLNMHTLMNGAVTDSIMGHKANGHVTRLHMNQLVIPYSNITGKPTLFSGSYTDLTNKPTIPTNTNQLTNGSGFLTSSSLTPYSTKIVSDGLYYPLGSNPSNYLTSVPAQSWGSTTGKPTFATVATTGDYNDLSNKPTNSTYTYNNNVSRSLNSNYIISSTAKANVTYTVRIAYNITVLLGSTGAVSLQYSTNGGSSFVTVSTVSNSLNLGLALTGYNDFIVSGYIPANAIVKIVSTSTNATVTYRDGQELLIN